MRADLLDSNPDDLVLPSTLQQLQDHVDPGELWPDKHHSGPRVSLSLGWQHPDRLRSRQAVPGSSCSSRALQCSAKRLMFLVAKAERGCHAGHAQVALAEPGPDQAGGRVSGERCPAATELALPELKPPAEGACRQVRLQRATCRPKLGIWHCPRRCWDHHDVRTSLRPSCSQHACSSSSRAGVMKLRGLGAHRNSRGQQRDEGRHRRTSGGAQGKKQLQSSGQLFSPFGAVRSDDSELSLLDSRTGAPCHTGIAWPVTFTSPKPDGPCP